MKDGIGASPNSVDHAGRVDGHGVESQSVDDQGVDRSQIRAFLQLTPAERLRKMQGFANAVLRIRHMNQGDARR